MDGAPVTVYDGNGNETDYIHTSCADKTNYVFPLCYICGPGNCVGLHAVPKPDETG